jgi:hypothetical protein
VGGYRRIEVSSHEDERARRQRLKKMFEEESGR